MGKFCRKIRTVIFGSVRYLDMKKSLDLQGFLNDLKQRVLR